MTVIWLALLGAASGASLDQLEVGGPWGTPTATDATALWWNPAGLAAGSGTRMMGEVAPIGAVMRYDRTDPYGRDGLSTYQKLAAIPFAGVVSDLSVKGLGVGAGLAVPTARGATMVTESSADPPGDGRYAMRMGNNQSAHLMAAAAYQPHRIVSFGASAQVVLTQWQAVLDSQVATSYYDSLSAAGRTPQWGPRVVEDPDYAATIAYDPLKGTAFTWSAGVHLQPIDRLSVAATWVSGYRAQNTGTANLYFDCPPQNDTFGRYAAEVAGLCYTTVNAAASMSYNLPSRLQGGVSYTTPQHTRVELMGAWVGWHVFDNYDSTMTELAERNPDLPASTAASLSEARVLARDAQDTWWAGVDVKQDFKERFTVGGRVLYDKAAIPDTALSPSNFDADAMMLSGLFAVRPTPNLEIGLSGTWHYLAIRTVTNSGYGVTLDPASRNEERWFYPHNNGSYGSTILRGGLQVRARFGKDDYQRGLLYTDGETPPVVPTAPPKAPDTPLPQLTPVVIQVQVAPDAYDTITPEPEPQPGLRVVHADTTRFPGRLERVAGGTLDGEPVARYAVNPSLDPRQAASAGDLLSRLWGAFGPPGEVRPDGFVYAFRDSQTGLEFAARVAGMGAEYVAPAASAADPRYNELLTDFDHWLSAQKPTDCELRYSSPEGRRVAGARNGQPFDQVEAPTP